MKPTIVKLNDELDDYDFGNMKTEEYGLIVYSYSRGGYDGSGLLVARRRTGGWDYKWLGHCSCYGPMDGWEDDDNLTFSELVSVIQKEGLMDSDDRAVLAELGRRFHSNKALLASRKSD